MSSSAPHTAKAAPAPSLIYRPATITDHLPLSQLFPVQQPIEIEIGSGDGSFLAKYAEAHRDTNFIGIERLLGRVRKLEKKAFRAGLSNIRILRLEASYIVRYLFPPNSVRAFHIYFPDPWPKRRHWKNRLITVEFTRNLERSLQPGGSVYLRTDNQDYFTQMLESFAQNPHFEKFETPPDLLSFITDFEREFHKRGVPTLHATYRLK
jgi:tRNA (guanine-N7-)-methyltransferase